MPGISLQDTAESSNTETEPINEAVSSPGHAAHVTNTENSPNNSESPNTTTLQPLNVSGSTPLNIAAMQDNVEIVKLFIDAGFC